MCEAKKERIFANNHKLLLLFTKIHFSKEVKKNEENDAEEGGITINLFTHFSYAQPKQNLRFSYTHNFRNGNRQATGKMYTIAMRVCVKCLQEKSLSDTHKHKEKRRKNGTKRIMCLRSNFIAETLLEIGSFRFTDVDGVKCVICKYGIGLRKVYTIIGNLLHK